MSIFSKLSSVKLSKMMDRTKTSAVLFRLRLLVPRGETVLSGVKVAATVAGKLGSSVPYMQGIVDAANEVVAYAEAMKTNRKSCKEISALTEDLVNGLLTVTEGVEEDDLNERLRLNLAELEWKLERVSEAMRDMRKATLIQMILSKDKYTAELVDHRRALQDAVSKFQLTQCVGMDVSIARIERKVAANNASVTVVEGLPFPGRSEWLFGAVTRGLRSKDLFVLAPLKAQSRGGEL